VSAHEWFWMQEPIYTLTEFLNLLQDETNVSVCLRIEVKNNDTSTE